MASAVPLYPEDACIRLGVSAGSLNGKKRPKPAFTEENTYQNLLLRA
jgi:hypothetical protein